MSVTDHQFWRGGARALPRGVGRVPIDRRCAAPLTRWRYRRLCHRTGTNRVIYIYIYILEELAMCPIDRRCAAPLTSGQPVVAVFATAQVRTAHRARASCLPDSNP